MAEPEKLKFFAVGNLARGVIAVGNVAVGVVAIGNVAVGVVTFGLSLSFGVVSIGLNSVGALLALGLNAAGLFAFAGINGVGTYVSAGVNGSGLWGGGRVNSAEHPLLPLVVSLAATTAVFLASALIRGRPTEVATQRLTGTLRDVLAGRVAPGWVRARVRRVNAARLQIESGLARAELQLAPDAGSAAVQALATPGNAVRVYAQLAWISDVLPGEGDLRVAPQVGQVLTATRLELAPPPPLFDHMTLVLRSTFVLWALSALIGWLVTR